MRLLVKNISSGKLEAKIEAMGNDEPRSTWQPLDLISGAEYSTWFDSPNISEIAALRFEFEFREYGKLWSYSVPIFYSTRRRILLFSKKRLFKDRNTIRVNINRVFQPS
jgi:hypothetical protein